MAQGRPINSSYSSSSSESSAHPPTPASTASTAEYVYNQPSTLPVYQDYFNSYQQPYMYQHHPHHTYPALQTFPQPAYAAQYDQSQQQSQTHAPPQPSFQPQLLPPPVTYAELPGAVALVPSPYEQYTPFPGQLPPPVAQNIHPQQQPPAHAQLPQLSGVYKAPVTSPVTTTDHPEWPNKYRELIKHYQDHVANLVLLQPETTLLWQNFVVQLTAKHPFLAFAICAFASLHMDYCQKPQQFEASELSMNLYNQALAQCGAECTNVSPENFEAAYFATHLIWLCSYRLTKTIPFYSDFYTKTDLFSLGKGPISILTSMRTYLPTSSLRAELLTAPEVGNTVPTRLLDSLLMLSQMLTMDGDLAQNSTQILEMLRNGPVSPPVDENNVFAGKYNNPLYSGHSPLASSSQSPAATTRKKAYIEVLRDLRQSVRKTVATGNFAHLHRWSMNVSTVSPHFLSILREERRPFALVIMAHYFALLLFHSKPSLFWLHERLINEVNDITAAISGVPEIAMEWTAFLKWPTMVLQTVQAQQAKDQALGIEVFKQMIQYTL